MARKGKEPAGLRRYRLEQKRKKAGRRKARAAPKRKVRTMARRRYGRKRSRKQSTFGLVKGVVYAGSIAGPAYTRYAALKAAGKPTGEALAKTATGFAFMDWEGNFDAMTGAECWGPVAVLTVVDLVSSRVGLQRRIARGLSQLLG